MKIKEFFYGTANLDLDVGIEIDPNYENLNKFEFGNGFYLSPYKNVAIDYARNGILEKYLKSTDLSDESNVEALLDGSIFKANIHKYKINLESVEPNNFRMCSNEDQYEELIKKTLEGYKNYEVYSPKEEYTYGMLCGKYWDENAKDHMFEECFAKKCRENMMIVLDDDGNEVNAKQLCLHHNRDYIEEHDYTTITSEIFSDEQAIEKII